MSYQYIAIYGSKDVDDKPKLLVDLYLDEDEDVVEVTTEYLQQVMDREASE